MVGPIEGLRVVDCSRGTAGPRATGMLADYGADVVWVEPPGGDPLRRYAPEAVVGPRPRQAQRRRRSPRRGCARTAARADRSRRDLRRELATRGRATGSGWATTSSTRAIPRWSTCRSPGSVRTPTVDLPGYEPARAGGARQHVRSGRAPRRSDLPRVAVRQHRRGIARRPRALAALRRAREDGHGRHVRTSLLDGALAYHSMLWGESDASVASREAPLSFQSMARTRLVDALVRMQRRRVRRSAHGRGRRLRTGDARARRRRPRTAERRRHGHGHAPDRRADPDPPVRAGRHLQDAAPGRVGAAVPRRRRVRGRAPPADRGLRHTAGAPQRDGGHRRRSRRSGRWSRSRRR